MESFYSPDQLPLQELQHRLPQQHPDQQQAQPQPNGVPTSRPDLASAAQLQLQMQFQHQQQQSVMPNQIVQDQSNINVNALDDMTRNNHNDMQRRRSMPQAYGHPLGPVSQSQSGRRMSSMDTGDMLPYDSDNADLGNYQFSQQMSTAFSPMGAANLSMQDGMSYLPDPNKYPTLSPDMMGTMMSSQFANMDMGAMGTAASSMDLFQSTNGSGPSPIVGSLNDQYAVANNFTMNVNPDEAALGASNDVRRGMGNMDCRDQSIINVAAPQFASIDSATTPTADGVNRDVALGGFAQNIPTSLSAHISSRPANSPQHGTSSTSITQPSSSDATTPITVTTPRDQPKEKTIYSKSGFDMLKALWLVATRKDPKIHLGAVDMSCAFVVCDVTMNDCPIIYVSDNFQNLTGYSRHEIVGQNCRFLQAPDGKVESGSKREFVDDGAVYNLKKMIQERREVQQSLINYRKGGKPFLNLLTMIPIPWDTDDIRYFIGFQIDLVECPDAISAGQEMGGVKVNYKHSDIGQYIWTPPASSQWEPDNGQTLGVDDVSTLLQQFNPNGLVSDWHKQSWDKMLLENTDDVVHVLSLKGLFLYLSPACKRVLEYDAGDLVGNSLSSVCHPSDIVPVTRELKDATAGNQVNIVFRIRRKQSGYTWFESHGSLFVEQGKGRKCIILVGRKRPVFALNRRNLEANGGIGDSEVWTKLSTSGMFLSVSSNVRSLLDLQPESLVGTSIQDLMRKESRSEFGRTIEKARRGKIASCKHEVQNRRGQGLQAQTVLYPGDASEGQKPSFLLAQTKLLKASSRSIAPANTNSKSTTATPRSDSFNATGNQSTGEVSQPAGGALAPGTQDAALASDDNIFDELRTTKCSSWQFELRQMEKVNRILAEELGGLLSNKKKRKRRKGVGNVVRDCANCHTRNTPEWRRGPSGQRDLCNSCGLRWAKQTGRVSPRNSTRGAPNCYGDSQSKKSASPIPLSPLHANESTNPNAAHGEGSVDPAQLSNKATTVPSGAASASSQNPALTMPPPSQSSFTGGAVHSSMTSIREERETSQP